MDDTGKMEPQQETALDSKELQRLGMLMAKSRKTHTE